MADVSVWKEVTRHTASWWFCQLHFDDPAPNRPDPVKSRKHWGEAGACEEMMRRGAQQRIGAGLVRGWHLGVPGTYVTPR